MKQQNCIDTMQPDFSLQAAPTLSLAENFMRVTGSVGAFFATLCLWQQRTTMRQRMAALDVRILDDIGLSREQVMAEAKKPFWKA